MKKVSGWFKALALLNIISFAAVVVVNYLAVSLPIGGMSTGALSDLYPNLFVPAGVTFSIWGLIYFMLAAFVIWQVIDAYKKQSKALTQKMGIWFFVSCLINISWIFAWHFQQVLLSVVVMVLFLVTLIIISNRLRIGQKLGTWKEKLFVQIPFSLYLGWICVATIANASALLVHIGWNMRGLSDILWTVIVIVVAILLALLALYKKYDIVFAFVVVWALVGIILKRIDIDPFYANNIIWACGIGISVISMGIGFRFEKWRNN